MRALVSIGLLGVLLAGCGDDDDPGNRDGGPDAGGGTDSGPSPCGVCAAPLTACDTETVTCVECVADDDCRMRYCDLDSHSCVVCTQDSHCPEPSASNCDPSTHRCTGCLLDEDCAGMAGTPLCDTAGTGGRCVECTAADATACGTFSCNVLGGVCTTTPDRSVRTCGNCVADSECTNTAERCVFMAFMMSVRTTGYCLAPPVGMSCPRPYPVGLGGRRSFSGEPEGTYCGIDEDTTTCEALLDLIDGTTCTAATDCGTTGAADGLCETVSGTSGRCTIPCMIDDQCPAGLSCTGGHCA